ncbi:conserved hypothetical protein [Verticillium alfalfae VaMs.102]|uniref:Uncharacterized protein n=1 Tax=Verticillium alfalfae (strain VaMs.102 / ATCC MYA-4576 / FGSC 10136) TaxID=526221 RepID=C9SR65_VERA1|nr:conserved hypothetical protein [Verticillium alfalfae VaMs.102]EEY20867.1 conserved hypothetical protein [Verticillium alfalfae VaMs.102]
MDASILMNSEYIPPLAPSDFTALLEHIFSIEGSSRLRHATARKLVRWRKRQDGASCSEMDSTICGVATRRTDSQVVSAALRRSPSGRNWGQWTQVRLVDWASDLQRSLVRDRVACDRALYEQRTKWLESQSAEEIDARMALTLASRDNGPAGKPCRRSMMSGESNVRPQDPLGLVQLGMQMKWTGWFALELAGSASVMGCVAFWILSS